MKLLNQSGKKDGRALIVDPKYIIKGGVFLQHDIEKTKAYFNPQTRIEFEEKYGKSLLKMYPDLLMQLDEQTEKPVDPDEVKKVKKVRKVVKAVKAVKKAKKR